MEEQRTGRAETKHEQCWSQLQYLWEAIEELENLVRRIDSDEVAVTSPAPKQGPPPLATFTTLMTDAIGMAKDRIDKAVANLTAMLF